MTLLKIILFLKKYAKQNFTFYKKYFFKWKWSEKSPLEIKSIKENYSVDSMFK